MTNLKGRILMHAPSAWDEVSPNLGWDALTPGLQRSRIDFANNLIHNLITAGVLAKPATDEYDMTWSNTNA